MFTSSVRMPAVSPFRRLNAITPYTTMKTPNNVNVSNSIIESYTLNTIAICVESYVERQ